jgi:predicted phage baseplate assembly protein
MRSRCGCCKGVEALTPTSTWNRPGLSQVVYRVGTHATFFETMQARLSSLILDIPTGEFDEQKRAIINRIYPLKDLKTRERSDPAIALLDAWAVVGDVLSFYQERIANEGYLRTATERRSVLELARLIGYRLRPGVAASVYLAYTLEDKSAPVVIPTGTRSQSVPGPGEAPQFFETAEPLEARVEWNSLLPRTRRPMHITFQRRVEKAAAPLKSGDVLVISKVFFEGTATNLNRGDALLFVFGKGQGEQVVRRVDSVIADFATKTTEVRLQPIKVQRRSLPYLAANALALMSALPQSEQPRSFIPTLETVVETALLGGSITLTELVQQARNELDGASATLKPILDQFIGELDSLDNLSEPQAGPRPTTNFAALVNSLLVPPSPQLANRFLQSKQANQVFSPTSDANPHLLASFHPELADTLYSAWANAGINSKESAVQAVYALRATAPLFGYNAPDFELLHPPPPGGVILSRSDTATTDPASTDVAAPVMMATQGASDDWLTAAESAKQVDLDQVYKAILPDSFVIVQTPYANKDLMELERLAILVESATTTPRTDYAVSAKLTRLGLARQWFAQAVPMNVLRRTIVYGQAELLQLAEEPLLDDIGGQRVEMARLYDGLQAGRWLMVSGERTDIAETGGVRTAELVMLAGVEQDFDSTLEGDRQHSTLLLERSLAYTYRRDTVRIYGNVVKATNGETRSEVLGSGDAAQAFQRFTLKQPPLTYVSAPTVEGIESTLQVRVNDVEWHEADSLTRLGPNDRLFVTETDDEAKTAVIFGDGKYGARPATGIENITAVYRSGIGKGGNVNAGQITLPITKPLGVKEVVNPLRASGGADKESRDMARRNAPLAVMALDRLVSISDYADFARTFAGIAKASAQQLTDGLHQFVHLTIAGVDDIPIDTTSDLYQNLRRALELYGDPNLAIRIEARERLALFISAKVHILPDYLEEKVAPKIRYALVKRFGFDYRDLGQPAFLSEAISTIQRVEGVAYVDVDLFDSISEADLKAVLTAKDRQVTSGDEAVRYATGGLALTLKQIVEARLATANNGQVKPAQLTMLVADAPETLILNLFKEATQ